MMITIMVTRTTTHLPWIDLAEDLEARDPHQIDTTIQVSTLTLSIESNSHLYQPREEVVPHVDQQEVDPIKEI